MGTTDTALSGAKAILEYCSSILLPRQWDSILKLHIQEEFPLTKIGGTYESDKDLIIEWRKNRVAKGLGIAAPGRAALGKKPARPRQRKEKSL
jgi:hypothetical protein